MSIRNAQNITIKIDGKQVRVPEGSTVLQAARKANIYIPTLCYLDNLKNYGGCRLCIVEIKNTRGFPTACTTPVCQGMEVTTKSSELQELRREILELVLSEHPFTCLICKDKESCADFMHTTRKVSVTTGCNFCTNNGNCELQDLVEYLELKDVRFPITYRNIKPIKDNPFYELDYNLCVLCGRCVRICNEERYSEVLAFVQRGNSSIVGTAFGESQKDAGCEYCGACVDVCPTGSISEKMGQWVGVADKSIRTTCPFCPVACTMNINTKGNRIINVGPEPGKRTEPLQLCVRGKFVPGDITHHPDRIRKPLIKKDNKWIEVTWEKALKYLASNLDRYRGNQFGLIGSAQDSIENNYILQKFTRKVMRSNNVDLLLGYPNKTLLKKIHEYHSVFPPVQIENILKAETIFIIGANCDISHPIIENRIRKSYKAGKQVIVANNHYNKTYNFSNKYVIYQPGKEISFLLLLLSELITRNKNKVSKEISGLLKNFNIKKALQDCGVSVKEIKDISASLLKSRKLIIIVGDNVLRTADNLSNFNTLLNLKLIMKKSAGCQILFLLDEGNRYGATLAGMHPDYLGGFDEVDDKALINKWSDNWNTKLSNIGGVSADEMINNISEDGITSMYVIGDIPAHPNLSGLKFFVQQNMFLTETSKYADVFLPLTGFTEVEGHAINVEGELKKINPVIQPVEGIHYTWEVISEIAGMMSEEGFNYKKTSDIFTEVKSFIDLKNSSAAKNQNEVLPVSLAVSGKTDKFPVSLIIEPNCFHYMGNILSALIPDMKVIREEGILCVSPELAGHLNIKDGDNVMLFTEFGKSKQRIKIMSDLIGKTAFFKPVWEHLYLFGKGLSLDRSYIDVKIEKG